MAEYDNTNKGALYKNDKDGVETRPDYTGKINVNGKDFRLAAWIKKGQNGTFMSLNVSEFQQKEAPKKSQTGGLAEMDDDLPF